ncbi:hypothetical protein BV25DRAFT_660061 [Artomyces pyxidatus]|uniref:Uncharacterized protein n=1 Tax=Artomyces pyxidatus TaxID=48021 RepID=A0ACB8T1X7_9AGAM|nr:hypothetical protein BV25DRAFT_660061 [Artomyces pyxidatus]
MCSRNGGPRTLPPCCRMLQDFIPEAYLTPVPVSCFVHATVDRQFCLAVGPDTPLSSPYFSTSLTISALLPLNSESGQAGVWRHKHGRSKCSVEDEYMAADSTPATTHPRRRLASCLARLTKTLRMLRAISALRGMEKQRSGTIYSSQQVTHRDRTRREMPKRHLREMQCV